MYLDRNESVFFLKPERYFWKCHQQNKYVRSIHKTDLILIENNRKVLMIVQSPDQPIPLHLEARVTKLLMFSERQQSADDSFSLPNNVRCLTSLLQITSMSWGQILSSWFDPSMKTIAMGQTSSQAVIGSWNQHLFRLIESINTSIWKKERQRGRICQFGSTTAHCPSRSTQQAHVSPHKGACQPSPARRSLP